MYSQKVYLESQTSPPVASQTFSIYHLRFESWTLPMHLAQIRKDSNSVDMIH